MRQQVSYTLYICDRCGTETREFSEGENVPKDVSHERGLVHTHTVQRGKPRMQSHDLCSRCVEDLRQFMSNKQVKKEESAQPNQAAEVKVLKEAVGLLRRISAEADEWIEKENIRRALRWTLDTTTDEAIQEAVRKEGGLDADLHRGAQHGA